MKAGPVQNQDSWSKSLEKEWSVQKAAEIAEDNFFFLERFL